MPFVTPSLRRRILITGETGSGKTHSLRSFPGPKYIMMFPGEKGQDTLLNAEGVPLDADTTVRVWESGDKAMSSSEVIEQVRKETIASKQMAGLQTWCGDGYHKLYEYVIDALCGGEYFAGSRFQTETRDNMQVVDPRVTAQAEHWMADYISLVSLSKIPYVVFTGWDKDAGVRRAKIQPDGKKEKWTDIPTFKMPALYSAASRKILGEFGICVHASAQSVRREVKGKFERIREYRWQTQADDEVGACAIKGDAQVTQRVPKFVPADWRELAKYLEAQG